MKKTCYMYHPNDCTWCQFWNNKRAISPPGFLLFKGTDCVTQREAIVHNILCMCPLSLSHRPQHGPQGHHFKHSWSSSSWHGYRCGWVSSTWPDLHLYSMPAFLVKWQGQIGKAVLRVPINTVNRCSLENWLAQQETASAFWCPAC